MKNILYFDYARRTYHIGGGQIYLKKMVCNLNREDFYPYILSLSDGKIFNDLRNCTVIDNNIPEEMLDLLEKFDAHGIKNICSLKNINKLIKWISISTKNLRYVVKKYGIDIIHINGMVPLIVVIVSLTFLKANTVYHVHHVHESLFARLILNLFTLFVDRTISISKFVKQNAFIFNRTKDRIIYNGINIKPLDLTKTREKSILIVGNLIELKGHKYFFSAIKLIADEVRKNGFVIHVLGDGNERKNLENMVSYLELDDIIKFDGFCINVENVMKKSMILVHASIQPESFGLVIIEGMMNGCIVIASDLGGPNEIIDQGNDGYLVSPFDTGAMAKLIKNNMVHIENRQKLYKKAWLKVNNKFNIQKNMKLIERLYNEIG